MRVARWAAYGLLLAALCASAAAYVEDDDDDFGILEDHEEEAFVEDEVEAQTEEPSQQQPQEDTAEASEDFDPETSHLSDSEEFEGFYPDEAEAWRGEAGGGEPKLKVAEVPPHLRSSWHAYPLEALLLLGLALYTANYLHGRARNAAKARHWFMATRPVLAQNFALVGDDGRAQALSAEAGGEGTPAPASPARPAKATYDVLRESDSLYSIYCSGRLHLTSCTVELRLVKRQDLLSLGLQLLRPSGDEAVVRLRLDAVEPGVLCLTNRKHVKYAREMNDVITYGGSERKGFLPTKQYGEAASKFSVWAELPEAAQSLLSSPRLLSVLPKYLDKLNYLHVTDQYTGVRLPDADTGTPVSRQTPQRVVVLSVALTEDQECLRQTLLAVLGLADRLATFKLSKESKAKAVKNRARTEEAIVRSAHLARSERAMEKREERKREEREKMLEIEDPERQRRWEEKENKRLARKRVPKVKQMRVN